MIRSPSAGLGLDGSGSAGFGRLGQDSGGLSAAKRDSYSNSLMWDGGPVLSWVFGLTDWFRGLGPEPDGCNTVEGHLDRGFQSKPL